VTADLWFSGWPISGRPDGDTGVDGRVTYYCLLVDLPPTQREAFWLKGGLHVVICMLFKRRMQFMLNNMSMLLLNFD
jgi:hypothetical protein